MTPEERVLRALDELRDGLAAYMAQRGAPADPPALLTLSEAARALGVSRSTATRWADDGRLRTVGSHRSRRVPRGVIEGLAGHSGDMESRRARGSGSEPPAREETDAARLDQSAA
jgi:excisionase family DNA binding protein